MPGADLIRPGIIVQALSIDRYAYELMREMAPTRKSYGQFISALILAEHARRQARELSGRSIQHKTGVEGDTIHM